MSSGNHVDKRNDALVKRFAAEIFVLCASTFVRRAAISCNRLRAEQSMILATENDLKSLISSRRRFVPRNRIPFFPKGIVYNVHDR